MQPKGRTNVRGQLIDEIRRLAPVDVSDCAGIPRFDPDYGRVYSVSALVRTQSLPNRRNPGKWVLYTVHIQFVSEDIKGGYAAVILKAARAIATRWKIDNVTLYNVKPLRTYARRREPNRVANNTKNVPTINR